MTSINEFKKRENEYIERWKVLDSIYEDNDTKARTTNSIGSAIRRAGVMEEYTQRARNLKLSRREYFFLIVNETHPKFIKNIYKPQEGRSFYAQFGDYLLDTSGMKFIEYLQEYLRRVR